jgi:hypothetical protein
MQLTYGVVYDSRPPIRDLLLDTRLRKVCVDLTEMRWEQGLGLKVLHDSGQQRRGSLLETVRVCDVFLPINVATL